jgi:regulatory protein
LKARALLWLAQREQSRSELRRKLLPHARAEALAQATDAASAAAEPTAEERVGAGPDAAERAAEERVAAGPDAAERAAAEPAQSPAARVDAVLDWLEAHRYLSAERFVEARVHARASRFGNLRIRQELAQHQVALQPDAALALARSEFDRARAVRTRKFPAPPATAAEHARQARFLAGRGFSADVIGRVLRGQRGQFDPVGDGSEDEPG